MIRRRFLELIFVLSMIIGFTGVASGRSLWVSGFGTQFVYEGNDRWTGVFETVPTSPVTGTEITRDDEWIYIKSSHDSKPDDYTMVRLGNKTLELKAGSKDNQWGSYQVGRWVK